MNKAFWSHFEHFGRFPGKIYLFLIPRVDKNWVWPKGKIYPFGGGGKVSDKQHMAAILDIKYPQTPWFAYFPATRSFKGQIMFSKSPSQQKFAWKTDILRNSSRVKTELNSKLNYFY